uniref:Uncharacterized protein n=1 Tax=Arundo donax TaxID=35708 RepID=A0A0A8Z864_ARUDO
MKGELSMGVAIAVTTSLWPRITPASTRDSCAPAMEVRRVRAWEAASERGAWRQRRRWGESKEGGPGRKAWALIQGRRGALGFVWVSRAVKCFREEITAVECARTGAD